VKLFVTGGTGFIGTHFVAQALAAEHEVIALRRSGSSTRLPLDVQPEWVEGSLDQDWTEALTGCDAVVHLASHTPNPPYAPIDDCLYWNVYAALKLARRAVAMNVRKFLVAGSCFEYGLSARDGKPVGLHTTLQPLLSYPTSKAAASIAFEGFAREHHIFLKILRIFQVYGPGEQSTRLWPALRAAALSGADFPMTFGEQVRDFIRVEDVAAAFMKHLDFETTEAGRPTTHNIGSGTAQSLREFAEYWWDHWGATGRLQLGAVPYRTGEIMRLTPAAVDVDLAS
jgi:nucleoside-diphosphate-sugar epimerase